MLRLTALMAAITALAILLVVIREERLIQVGRVPTGRLRRLWLQQERRVAPRYRVNWMIRYQRAETNGTGQIKDLSETGIGILLRERVEEGAQLQVECMLPQRLQPLVVLGKVTWVREIESGRERLFYVGIQFFKLDPHVAVELNAALKQDGAQIL